MKNLQLSRRELLLKGVLASHLADDFILCNLQHDSRLVQANDAFICLSGENHDGHRFIETALAQKASLIIFSNPNFLSVIKGAQVNYILVEDTTLYLGELAGYVRKKYNPVVIAVTGSNGKTSTKEILYKLFLAVLKPDEVIATQGNFNNQWGVPFTLLRITTTTKFVIVEIGTNHRGEIAYLTKLSQPNYAVLTSVAEGHIGNFQSVEEIADEKTDIFVGIDQPGDFFYAASLQENRILHEKWQAHRKNDKNYFSSDSVSLKINSFVKQNIPSVSSLTKVDTGGHHQVFMRELQYRDIVFYFSLLGRHQLQNLSLAILTLEKVLAHHLDFFQGQSLSGLMRLALENLRHLKPAKGRLQLAQTSPYVIFDDTYNANLASFQEAIATVVELFRRSEIRRFPPNLGENRRFSHFPQENRAGIALRSRTAKQSVSSRPDTKSFPQENKKNIAANIVANIVIGQMAELGTKTIEAHLTLIEEVFHANFQFVFFISNDENCRDAMRQRWQELGGSGENFIHSAADDQSVAGLNQKILKLLKEGDWLLVKGSRSARCERVVEFFVPAGEKVFPHRN